MAQKIKAIWSPGSCPYRCRSKWAVLAQSLPSILLIIGSIVRDRVEAQDLLELLKPLTILKWHRNYDPGLASPQHGGLIPGFQWFTDEDKSQLWHKNL